MTTTMPLVFVGHGSPTNALSDNAFTQTLFRWSTILPRPKLILCISAHWLTDGVFVTDATQPKTIHDFGGFAPELYQIQYPAPGDKKFADELVKNNSNIQSDGGKWGLDHGAWSVLKHMYPKADIPVVQLSIDIKKPPQHHFEIGRQLNRLRNEGVLILGSGNIVHNLQKIIWLPQAQAYEWAITFDEWVKNKIHKQDYDSIVNEALGRSDGQMSVPYPDHWYPLLTVLGAADSTDSIVHEFEGMEYGSLSMRSFVVDKN